MSTLKKTKKSIIKLIHQIMYDFDRIATINEIEYWTSGGTTLGAIRHTSCIPWDDDADICMKTSDLKKFKALKSQFKKCGYFIVKTWFGYKICYENRPLVDGLDYSFPNLDVFLMKYEKQTDKWIPKYKIVRDTWPKEYYIDSDLFPLKRHAFASYHVNIPKNYKKYFDRMYGKNWNKVAYREYDHQKEEEVEKVIVKLTPKDRLPAQPITVKKRRCIKSK